MSQVSLDIANSNGATYRAAVNAALKAVQSNFKGASRHASVQVGGFWIDDSASPWVLNVYDGGDDIAVGTIDPTTNDFRLTGISDFAKTFLTNADASSARATLELGSITTYSAAYNGTGTYTLSTAIPSLVDGEVYTIYCTGKNFNEFDNVLISNDGTVYDLVYAASTGTSAYVNKFPANAQAIRNEGLHHIRWDATNNFFKLTDPERIIHYNPSSPVSLDIGDTILQEKTDQYPGLSCLPPTNQCSTYDVNIETISNESNTNSEILFQANSTNYSSQFSRANRVHELDNNIYSQSGDLSRGGFTLGAGARVFRANLKVFVDNDEKISSLVLGEVFASVSEGTNYSRVAVAGWWRNQGSTSWSSLGNIVLDKSRTSVIRVKRTS